MEGVEQLAMLAEHSQDLDTVRGACLENGVTATLKDEQGFIRGWVDTKGHFRSQ